MRPERFLGVDPTPGDLAETDAVMGALREVVRMLVESRGRVDAQLSVDGVWSGPIAAPLSDALGALSRRLLVYEDAAADLARAVDEWRAGLAARSDRTFELVEQMSRLAGEDDADTARATLRASVDELSRDHEAAAAVLRHRVDEAAGTLEGADALGLADDLGRAAAALTAAVDDWVQQQAVEMVATATSLVEVAGLTRVVAETSGGPGLTGRRSRRRRLRDGQQRNRTPTARRAEPGLDRRGADLAARSPPSRWWVAAPATSSPTGCRAARPYATTTSGADAGADA